jgi:hypothetical protein
MRAHGEHEKRARQHDQDWRGRQESSPDQSTSKIWLFYWPPVPATRIAVYVIPVAPFGANPNSATNDFPGFNHNGARDRLM